jgi:acetate kinase
MTLNCGSSSVKYSLWEMPTRKLCIGSVERVTAGDSFIKHKALDREDVIFKRNCPSHDVALRLIMEFVTDSRHGVIKDTSEIGAVGHRVVHGGEKFKSSVLISEEVEQAIEDCSSLAPLHNPPNLQGIRAAKEVMPNASHMAVFDTAFLTTMPQYVYMYALPYEWFEKYGIRKYGFHGTSHLYVSKRGAAFLGKKPSEVNVITLHIGNGVSVTAVKEGLAFDHSMGFTPLEGAVMGTRCGDIDPAIPLYVMQKEKLPPERMETLLNKKSGLLGITGDLVDRRDVIKAANAGNKRARLALEVECYRLKKYIGAYAASMGKLDAVVFTAGVGENSPLHRAKTCEGLELLGIKIDPEKNEQAVGGKREMDISTQDSRVRVLVIPTNEELVIVEDVMAILEQKYDDHQNFEYSFQRQDYKPA